MPETRPHSELAEQTVTGPDQKGSTIRRYRPLDVHSYAEGARVICGWLIVPWLAVVCGLLMSGYELIFINVSDRDLRDLYYDQRVSGIADNYYHKHFINAAICCNTDPVIFKEPSQGCLPSGDDLSSDYAATWALSPLQCPPTVMLQCPGSLTSSSCQQLRRQLFTAAGLDPDTGQYANCLKAGKVLVGSQAVAVSRPALLAVLQQGVAAPVAQLTIPTPLNFTQASMQVFVDQAIASWGNPEYVSPNVRLTRAFSLDGQQLDLVPPLPSFGLRPIPARSGLRTISPWPRELFPWPGNNRRCPASERREQWYLFGTTELAVPPFTYDQPHNMVSTLRFLDDYILFSPWKVEQSAAGATLTSTPLADNITLSVVTEIKVWVGMVALAACQAWMIDKEKGLQLTYQEVYRGSLVDLVPDTPRQLVAVTVYDTAAPEYITLPAYGGMWYIWANFGMAAIWLFGLGLLILIAPVLIWWNVRDNRGLPPITYRYMKRFRGW